MPYTACTEYQVINSNSLSCPLVMAYQRHTKKPFTYIYGNRILCKSIHKLCVASKSSTMPPLFATINQRQTCEFKALQISAKLFIDTNLALYVMRILWLKRKESNECVSDQIR